MPSGDVGLLPPEARAHEPRVALDGGADGLDVLRRFAAGAPPWLAPGGHLLVETSERQAPLAAEAVGGGGLIPRVAHSSRLNATIIITMVVLGVGINFFQTYRSQRAVERLRQQVAPTATVLRDDQWQEIHRHDVVPDLVPFAVLHDRRAY